MNTTEAKNERGRPRIYLTKMRKDGLPRSFYRALSRYSFKTGNSVSSLIRAAVAYYINNVLRAGYPDVSIDEFDAEQSSFRTLIGQEDGDGKEKKTVRVHEVQPGI